MLDRNQPHQQVFGLPGVSWTQDGRLFDGAGCCVTFRRENTGDLDGAGDPVSRTIVERVYDEVPAPLPVEAAKSDLEHAHWRHLKAMLGQYGEEFTTKEAAIAFLRGRG